MLKQLDEPTQIEYIPMTKTVLDEVLNVCQQIPPLWDLENYVAVNPFLGFVGRPMGAAARMVRDGLGARVLPEIAFYRERWRNGAFGRAELKRAALRAGQEPAVLEAIINGKAAPPMRLVAPVQTFAERYDHEHGTHWNERVIRYSASWCAVQIPSDGPRWGQAPEAHGLYASWREAAQIDRSLEYRGLKGWRAWAATLPTEPLAAIETQLAALKVPETEREAYLYRLIGGVFGWASYLRRDVWAAGDKEAGPLLDLLAIRICTDAAVARLATPAGGRRSAPAAAPMTEDEDVRMIFQEALEDGYAKGLINGLKAPPQAQQPRPAVQAVFCIDVRSEILRRHFEAQSPVVETMGFAGFFAVFLDWQTAAGESARCPVLLQPGVHIRTQAQAPAWERQGAFKKLATAPSAAFTFVETLGLGYALGLAGDALTWLTSPRADEGAVPFTLDPHPASGLTAEQRLAMATLILKNMGLRERYGRIVLLAGHEGHSENNPHQAGLDCGACGGHGGAINARIAAAVLNDPQVRAALPGSGFQVPKDTHFLPGVHDTGTDEVRLLDVEHVPASHNQDLAQLRRWLAAAAAATRAERAQGMGITQREQGLIDRLIGQRTRDWSEVRPEWALARNAAFIAARRDRTRGVSLEGRSFLHEYDWKTDPDNSILTLILTAPMVVASWINLQYFGSTVDNEHFGCGTKTLHNRVGSLGVVLGNGGDLRTGLALQSVQAADGSWYHEPLRLQVMVEAPRERIEAIMTAHAVVRDLVENGWVRLFALDPDGNGAARWVPGEGWEPQGAPLAVAIA